jgi:hypothetical protein
VLSAAFLTSSAIGPGALPLDPATFEKVDETFGLKENKRIAGFFQKIMGQGTEP